MIIYAILGNLSVTAMFTAGFIPGFIVAFAMIMTAYLLAKRNGFKGDENAVPFNMKFFLMELRQRRVRAGDAVHHLGSI